MALVELENRTRLIVKDETEILIPASMREEMVRIFHLTHQADTAMLTQAKQTVKIQDVNTKKWTNGGEITNVRTTSDGTIASYKILTENGTLTTRHRTFAIFKRYINLSALSGQLSDC